MRLTVPMLLLSLLPALAQAGTIQLSPSSVWVDSSRTSSDITLMYTPSSGARSLEVSTIISLERLGWSVVEPVAQTEAGVTVRCKLTGGQVRALLFAPQGGTLPATPFALCRLRVRAHAHSPNQTSYSIRTVEAYETDASFNATSLPDTWGWVRVP